MPPLKAPVIKLPDLEHFKLPDPEKKGVMCTECKKVHWNVISVDVKRAILCVKL